MCKSIRKNNSGILIRAIDKFQLIRYIQRYIESFCYLKIKIRTKIISFITYLRIIIRYQICIIIHTTLCKNT